MNVLRASGGGCYHVGVATRDMTPPVGTHMAGFGSRTEPSEGVYRPLRATVTANYYWFRTGPWEDNTEDRIMETVRKLLCAADGIQPSGSTR